MKVGDFIKTPRFRTVEIKGILTSEQAKKQGFTEPTHYEDLRYKILGKSISHNRMVFAAVITNKKDSASHDGGKGELTMNEITHVGNYWNDKSGRGDYILQNQWQIVLNFRFNRRRNTRLLGSCRRKRI